MTITLPRRLASEFIGTLFLLTAVIGSAIMGERLAAGNQAVALLANGLATGAALVAIIHTFGPISGAHFNPAVTLAASWTGDLPWREAPAYILAQFTGAIAGAATAHLMFSLPILSTSTHLRHGAGQLLGEFVATFGLLATISLCAHTRPSSIPWVVGAYITAAYWFTSSTSFANPAVTLARSLSNTPAGIRPTDVTGFILAQLLGAAAAVPLFQWLTAPSLKQAIKPLASENSVKG